MNARFLKTVLTAALLTLPFAASAQDPKDYPDDGGIVPTGTEKPTTQPGMDKTGMDKTGMDKTGMDKAGMKPEKLGNIEVVKGIDNLTYGMAPNFLARGAEFALIDGDVAKGPFAGYLRVPSGYKMAAQRNAGDLQFVVVQGSVRIGQGQKSTASLDDFSDEGGMVHTGGTPSSGQPSKTGSTPSSTGSKSGSPSSGGMGASGTKSGEMGHSGAMGGELVVNEGGFVNIPRNEVFTLTADQNTILYVHGMGAWSPTFLNASDDPRSGKTPSGSPPAAR